MPTASVRDRRIRRGWSQEELAKQCAAKGAPVSRSAIGQIENGRVPRPRLRAVLAELLELDVAHFEKAS